MRSENRRSSDVYPTIGGLGFDLSAFARTVGSAPNCTRERKMIHWSNPMSGGQRTVAPAFRTTLFVAACSVALVACGRSTPPAHDSSPAESGGSIEGRVTQVVDGDSIKVDGRSIRLIGINAPERGRPYFAESRDALAQLLDGESVWLRHDVEVLDQFGRELAYVFLADGRHVNAEMLSAGFAQYYTIPPNLAFADELLNAERDAREAGRGLWRPSEVQVDIVEIVFDPPGPDGEDLNGEWLTVVNNSGGPVQLGGFSLSDESNNSFELPAHELAAGGKVRIHTGTGRPSDSALFLGRDRPLWNNDGDTAILRDADGSLIARYSYGAHR